jgi:putative nucleotidyltransferase with HDIG domain
MLVSSDARDTGGETVGAGLPAWKVLIVDDEPEVHEVTEMVLADFEFEGRQLAFLHAHSAEQARAELRLHGDVAVILLDVVMESEQAGLDLVHFIRRELNNRFVRIVLRTGQPGQAPEREVVANYDINDYKEKTELTSERLFTTLYATLRAYRDVMAIETGKCGLERVIACSAAVFSHQSGPAFGLAVLEQLIGLLGIDPGVLYCRTSDRECSPESFVVRAGTGRYRDMIDRAAGHALPEDLLDALKLAWREERSVISNDHFALNFSDSRRTERLFYVGQTRQLAELDLQLLELFCTNVSIAFENVLLNRELDDSQSEMLCLLAGVAETRSLETANHVRRVGELAAMLAEASGLDAQQVELIRRASPLHDIGKIGIPDAVLNKPGPHTESETETMRQHVALGAEMLSISSRPLFQLAAEIARDHHENWDGSGYPRGLKGTDISLSGRIVALSDVCDALGSRRCYKEAWSEDRVCEFIRQQREMKFDPALVDLLFERWDQVRILREKLPD